MGSEIMKMIGSGVGQALSFLFDEPEFEESSSLDEVLPDDVPPKDLAFLFNGEETEEGENMDDTSEDEEEKEKGLLDSLFDGSFIKSMGDLFGDFSNSYTITTRMGNTGEGPTTITTVEHVEKHGEETDRSVETTKVYADGHSSYDKKNFADLDEDSSFEDIFEAYKDIIDDASPKIMNLSELTEQKIGDALDHVIDDFWNKVFGMEDETILKNCDMSKEELIQDYQEFSDAYEDKEDEVNISDDPVLSEKFDKVANNFSRIMNIKH